MLVGVAFERQGASGGISGECGEIDMGRDVLFAGKIKRSLVAAVL